MMIMDHVLSAEGIAANHGESWQRRKLASAKNCKKLDSFLGLGVNLPEVYTHFCTIAKSLH